MNIEEAVAEKMYINGDYKMSQANIRAFEKSYNRQLEKERLSRKLSNETGEICFDVSTIDLPYETWVSVKYFGGITHQISNMGRVKSLRRKGNKMDKVLKPNKIRSSNDDPANYYLLFHLTCNKENIYKLGHVLVAEHFIDNPENKSQVNHKNGIKRDNRQDNLEWNTQVENLLHSYRELGRKKVVGVNHGLAKMTDDKVREARLIYTNENMSFRKLAGVYGISANTMASIIKKETWKHV